MSKGIAMMRGMVVLGVVLAGACASDEGDLVDCPTCDNVTELLVANRCVPIADVEVCGPDGHAHGIECHCFSGQQPTDIGGTEYCLQAECATQPPEDAFEHACEHLGDAPEQVTAVTTFADFEDAHGDLDALVEVALPGDGTSVSYLHFPGHESGQMYVFLDTPGVFSGAYNQGQQALATEDLGANPDCDTALPEIWEVEIVNESGSTQPQIIEFAAGTVTSVRLIILGETEHEH